jgi:hypothetical protein
MQSKSYHQSCATAGCANEADTRIALICRDCWNAAIHQASQGPLRPTVDGVLMPDDMIDRPRIDQESYAAEVKRGNSEFIRAYFALEDRAAELGVELDS